MDRSLFTSISNIVWKCVLSLRLGLSPLLLPRIWWMRRLWIFRSSYAIDLYGLSIDIFHIAFFMFVTKVTYVNYWSNKRRREVPGKEADEPSALCFYWYRFYRKSMTEHGEPWSSKSPHIQYRLPSVYFNQLKWFRIRRPVKF